MLTKLRRFSRDNRGAVLIEFAAAVPILMTVLLGCFEATRLVLINQKMERVVASIADLVAQQEGITTAQLNDLFGAAQDIADPFNITTTGRVIVSSVARPTSSAATIPWQRKNTGTYSATSKVGTQGGTATLPTGFTIRTGDDVIVAEIYYSYTPIFMSAIFPPRTLYHSAWDRPRINALTTIN